MSGMPAGEAIQRLEQNGFVAVLQRRSGAPRDAGSVLRPSLRERQQCELPTAVQGACVSPLRPRVRRLKGFDRIRPCCSAVKYIRESSGSRSPPSDGFHDAASWTDALDPRAGAEPEQ